jgi:serine phosphatase RsbU (regulator of sigma subunit)
VTSTGDALIYLLVRARQLEAGSARLLSMAEQDRRPVDLLEELQDAYPGDVLAVVSRYLRRMAAATEVELLLADYSELSLTRLNDRGEVHTGEPVPIETSTPGQSYLTQQPLVTEGIGGIEVHVPVTLRADRIGVLQVGLPVRPTQAEIDHIKQVASTLAYVVAVARRFTDLFERSRRRADLELAAEIQWELLPVLAYDCDAFSLAGFIEPAYRVGGDSFDYAVERESVTVSVTDAKGHGLRAALLSALAVTATRNARRRGRGISDQAVAANQALGEQFSSEDFVTALLLRVEYDTGVVRAVNAGHPPALLLREERTIELRLPASPPLGMFADSRYDEQPLDLQPRDRLLLGTDGLLETVPIGGGGPFGMDGIVRIAESTRGLRPSVVVRHATREVVAYRAGELRDDLTVVCIDWRGS